MLYRIIASTIWDVDGNRRGVLGFALQSTRDDEPRRQPEYLDGAGAGQIMRPPLPPIPVANYYWEDVFSAPTKEECEAAMRHITADPELYDSTGNRLEG